VSVARAAADPNGCDDGDDYDIVGRMAEYVTTKTRRREENNESDKQGVVATSSLSLCAFGFVSSSLCPSYAARKAAGLM
jgi:hypothetical protein